MKYAVIYQSKSGNTREIAEQIYSALWAEEKDIIDIDEEEILPQADVYFIGFGIHDGNCSMDIIDYLESLPSAKYAIFATCGYIPTEDYKKRLRGNLDVWLPDNGEYLGMFICQGKVERDRQNIMIGKMPTREVQLKKMFEEGSSHPNEEDLDAAANFAERIQEIVEYQ